MKLNDEIAREQAVNLLDSSLFIEAGAGTGKSTTLVNRIVATIERQDPMITIDQIAAITFTQRAGAELRNKLREGLESAVAKNPGNDNLRAALANLDGARVGTIHSLAQTILREQAISARIPLGFEVGADSDAKAARTTRSKSSVEAFLAQIGPESRETLWAYGVSISQLRNLFSEIDQNASRLTDSAFEVSRVETENLRENLLTNLQEFWSNSQKLNTDSDDNLFINMLEVIPPLIEIIERADPGEMLTKWKGCLKQGKPEIPTLGGGGSKKNWNGNDPKNIRAEFKEFSAAFGAFLFSPASHIIREGLPAVWQALRTVREERLSAGELEYDDLMSLTAELLERDASVREYVHNQLAVVMVDEFQDTDPLQWRIVRLITSDPSSNPTDGEYSPLPGRLVVVGDPKQAIYSFRGADIDTYVSALRKFDNPETSFGEVLSLTTNFRSVAPVIEKVNQVFGAAMAEGTRLQVSYRDLDSFHNPSAPNPGPALQVIRDPESESESGTKKMKEYNPNEMESKQLAFAISTAIKDTWQITAVTSPRTREFTRAARYSDITILYPTRTGTPSLLDSLDDYAIPYRSADAGLVYSRPVILGLKAALTTAVENMADLNLWFALKSPLFGCTDPELMEYRLSGNSWFGAKDEQLGVVPDSLRILNRLRSRTAGSTPVQLIDFLLDESRILEYLPRTHRGNFDADCIRMVKAHAQEWQDQGGAGLYEYLQWLDSVLADSTKTSLPEPDDQRDNAVRLMTIHQAKGLEFPIVVLSGMSREVPSNDPTMGITSQDHFEFKISAGKETAGYSTWAEEEYAPRSRAERIRLMYVALTRAQDHLILSLAGDSKAINKDGTRAKSPRFSELLIDSIPPRPEDITLIPDNPNPTQKPDSVLLEPLDPTWSIEIDGIRASTNTRWVSSPSGEGALALGLESIPTSVTTSSPVPDETLTPVTKTQSAEREMRDGTAIGQSVHRSLDTLIHIDAPTPQTISEVCAQIAAEEEALTYIKLITNMVNQALTSDTVQTAIASGQFWSEMYVAAPVEHARVKVVDGLIDLTYRDGNGIHIIDYKTDQVIDELSMQHYREQLFSYAELIRRATGEDNVTTELLHLTHSSCKKIEIK